MPLVTPPRPVPVAVPGLRVTSYGASSIVPIGISLDRRRVYGTSGAVNTGGSNGGTTLSESTDDGATWTTVKVFPDIVRGIIELDDGEALVFAMTAFQSAPSFVYRSTGWSTSHTTATWTKVLTTPGGEFRPAWTGHFSTFGDNAIRPGTSGVGFIAEYGGQTTTSGDQTGKARRGYLTTDYGATWTQVFDLLDRYPGTFPMHTHGAAYDSYWDRLWLTYGDQPSHAPNMAEILYSDDRGATWNSVPLPADWSGAPNAGLQSLSISVLRDGVLIGADNAPGFFFIPRKGFRVMGDIVTHLAVQTQNTNMLVMGMHRNRRQPNAPLLAGWISVATNNAGGLAASLDGGMTMTRIWRDPALVNNAGGPVGVFGPTRNGVIVAAVDPGNTTLQMLRGELVIPEAGMFVGNGTVTGDGTTTVFNFPHGLPGTPSRFMAWNEKPAGTYAVTATATNIVVTFTTAPANSTVIPFAWRAADAAPALVPTSADADLYTFGA